MIWMWNDISKGVTAHKGAYTMIQLLKYKNTKTEFLDLNPKDKREKKSSVNQETVQNYQQGFWTNQTLLILKWHRYYRELEQMMILIREMLPTIEKISVTSLLKVVLMFSKKMETLKKSEVNQKITWAHRRAINND